MKWKQCSLFLWLVTLVLEGVAGSVVRPWTLRSKREVRSRGVLCEDKEDNVLYALESDCMKYILCTGVYEYVASCPAGLFFDPNLQACNYDEGGACEAAMRTKNDVEKLGTLQPEENTGAISVSTVTLEPSTFCDNRPDGSYADPDNCDQYLLCSNNLPHVRKCPPNLIYRADTASCDFDRQNTCTTKQAGATVGGTRRITTRRTMAPTKRPEGDLASQVAAVMPGAVEKAMNNLMLKMRDETEKANNPTNSGTKPFKLVQSLQKGKPLVKQIAMNGFIMENATQEVMSMLGIESGDAMAMMKAQASPLSANPFTLKADERPPKADPSTCPYPRYRCEIEKYRSFDGSCNNLQKPIQGRSMTPLKRNLPADYGDGIETLRKGKNGAELPNPRLVSYSIHKDTDKPEPMHTLMLMQWGQFLDHDVTLTALTKLPKDPEGLEATVDVECGAGGCETELPSCKPIDIPPGDPDFGTSKKCLMFVRSEGVPNLDCKIGPREQLNQLTSYIDASQIYGSSEEEAKKLRETSNPMRGRLRTSPNPNTSLKKLLPTSTEDTMCLERQSTCYLAGDERVNEQSALTSLHVIWLREHNRIEAELHRIHPDWEGDMLYQETRRIVGALIQQITFSEFLPVVLGPIVMKKHGLHLLEKGFFNGYDASEDASPSNVFATAAFRFGHSLLTPSINMYDKNYKNIKSLQLSQLFFDPSHLTTPSNDGVDGILRGTCTGRVQTFDKFLTKEVTTKLFSNSPPGGLGTDLASLNIQRSRDHGIPGYNAWRDWCGLRKASNFDELVEMSQSSRDTFKALYKSVDDIDIFPAGLAETPVEGSLLGPTFSCILGKEFARFRKGDRFWYEKSDQFTAAQLQEIRKVKLSKIICQNGDNITTIQPAVFESPFREAYPDRDFTAKAQMDGLRASWFTQLWTADYNAKTGCDCLPAFDLSLW